MGFVVEFCGLPGAGKSTMARAVVGRLRLQGLPTADVMARLGPEAERLTRIRRKLMAVGRGAFDPGSARVVANVGFRSRQAAARDRVARPANLLVVRHEVRRARRAPGIHILDQGPLQEWWSASLRADAARVAQFAAIDPADQPDLVVRVDAPVDLLVHRLNARELRQSRLESQGVDALRVELERGEVLLDGLFDQLVHSSGAHTPAILRVEGLDPTAPETIAEAVLRAV